MADSSGACRTGVDQGDKRWQHTAVWNPQNKHMIVFGGWNEDPNRLGTLRQYKRQPDNWMNGPTGPAARTGHVAVWDDTTGSMLMCCGVSDVATLNDLWSFDGSWTELSPSGSITARGFASVVWNPTAQAMLGFGGKDSSNYLDTAFQRPGCI